MRIETYRSGGKRLVLTEAKGRLTAEWIRDNNISNSNKK